MASNQCWGVQCVELDVSCRDFGKHFCKIWVMVKPTHVDIAAEASPVGQKHKGGNWLGGLEGGVYCVAQESEHNFIVMRGMAEGETIVAHREGVCVCPEDLVTAAYAEISVEGTVNSRGLENLFVETMHHLCWADRMWGGVISVLEL
eukprot:1161648-Pelagomonas_calceolata.AAC.3